MDAITHMLLALAITEVGFRKTLGFGAIFFALFCGLLPDIDFLLHNGRTLTGLNEQQAYTHSLFILTALSPLLALGVWGIGCGFCLNLFLGGGVMAARTACE